LTLQSDSAFDLVSHPSGLSEAQRRLLLPEVTEYVIPIDGTRLPLPPWTPPTQDVEVDGILASSCLDRACSDAVEEVIAWLTEQNNNVRPDRPGLAGAERPYAEAYGDPDPNRAIQLFLLKLIARGLVRAHTSVFLYHEPCGSYQDNYGHGRPLPGPVEAFNHEANLPQAAAYILYWYYQLTGRTDHVVGAINIADNKTPEKIGCHMLYRPKLIMA
jgi:hypothetical protein